MSGERKSLDLLFEKDADTIVVISEAQVDTEFFNAEAWKTTLAFLKASPWVNGAYVDGMLTRLDRPEILCDELTHWTKSEAECDAESEAVRNRERLQHMRDVQLAMLKARLTELRAAMPKAKIVFSLRGDDMQYSFSALLHEILLLRDQECEEKVGSLQAKRGALQKEAKDLAKAVKNFAKDIKPGEKPSVKTAKKMASAEKHLQDLNIAIGKINSEIIATKKQQQFFREKKEGPRHQLETRKLVEGYYASVKSICDELGVEFIHDARIVKFGGLTVDVDHSRGKAWTAMLRVEECLVAATHGKMQNARRNFAMATKEFIAEAEKTHPDVILETGHHGKAFKRLQRLRTRPNEVNFKNNMKYDPNRKDEYVTLVCAPPFEDQERIREYKTGKKFIRMSGGKPTSTRNHEVFKRLDNNGVSGLGFISKPKGAPTGMVAVRFIQYADFKDKSVLYQPEEFAAFTASADEHIGAREAQDIVRDGFVKVHEIALAKSITLCGVKARVKGYVNGGDGADANQRKWQFLRYAERNPQELVRENLRLLRNLNAANVEELCRLAMKMTNDSKGGPVGSMRVIMRWLADYFDQLLLPTLAQPDTFQFAFIGVDGNHTRKALADLGLMDWDIFAERCRSHGVGVYESVEPDYYKPEPLAGVRVALGGYQTASAIFVENYGLGVNGELVSGMRCPIDLMVQHDPKGYSGDGAVNAGRSSGADLTISGHTHDGYLKCDSAGDNRFRVAVRLATLEGVTPTEIYYAGVPRTCAAHIISCPKPGDIMELAIPGDVLQAIGRESLMSEFRDEVAKEKNPKSGKSAK